ncbi:type IV pilus modification protein PilV [Dyella telluris]|uniref:Type IV pilus modification protein PilV n=1 Tax=Dyella telluris TaxID=2763498 RepID=A0A7G8Q0P0_9GAMM|nr:type IV pilus modification protein PilV [Dyella telluris]QNK00348.1 type IV pilus modification protein PilV [Dyella telluris]
MKDQRGIMLIEVLVSMFIAAIALLGTIALSMNSSRSQMESYQRVQALTLVQDMVSRINANRQVAACYSNGATGTVTNTTLPTCSTSIVSGSTTQQQSTANADLTAWQSELQGAAEVNGGVKAGAMIGAIGCITQTDAVNNVYSVTVAWQGLSSTVVNSYLTCGSGSFGASDALRRAVTVQVRIGNLSS